MLWAEFWGHRKLRLHKCLMDSAAWGAEHGQLGFAPLDKNFQHTTKTRTFHKTPHRHNQARTSNDAEDAQQIIRASKKDFLC